jgi:hypothetical protein
MKLDIKKLTPEAIDGKSVPDRKTHYSVDDIKKIPIVDYLATQGVEVRSNRCKAPWHETGGGNPQAVSISPTKNLWYDFVDNFGGTVIDICMKIEGLSFPEAIRELGARFNVRPSDEEIQIRRPKPKIEPNFIRVSQGVKLAIRNEDVGELTEVELLFVKRVIELMDGAIDDASLDNAVQHAIDEYKRASQKPELSEKCSIDFERFGHKVEGDSVNGCDTYGREIDGIDGCGSYFVTVNAGRESIRAAVSRNAAEIVKLIIDAHKSNKAKGGVEIPDAKLKEITNIITAMWLRSRGRLFWNAQTKQHDDSLFFDNERGQLFPIGSDVFQSWIANMTDISRSGFQYKTLYALIHDAAICPDVAAGVTPSKYYDRRGDTLYISNGDSFMLRVTATEISTVKNGTDDIVFLTGATLPPWKLLNGGGEDPFDAAPMFADAWYLVPSGKMLLRLWYLSMFAKHPKRPPLLITAPFQSGKTALFDGINYLLANRNEANAEITDTPQGKIDFWTAIHAGGLYCIDNADNRVSWLSDTLQRVSTGSALPKRKLYKDDILVCLYPNADIVVTSNNPRFADDCGLSDRFIIVRLEKRGERVSRDGELKADLLARRDAALTWTVRTLQRALATPSDTNAGGSINGRHPDFATFALRCAEAIGKRREAESALMQAELDKTLIVLQNAEVARDVLSFLRSVNGKWDGKASELAKEIWPDLYDADDRAIRSAGSEVAKIVKRYEDQFRLCFTFRTTNTGGVTLYHFTGIDKRLDTVSNEP